MQKGDLKMKKIICILLLVCTLTLCLASCGDDDSDSDTCGICGGSGTVTSKILGSGSGVQKGFDTYYRCKGCHGTGRK